MAKVTYGPAIKAVILLILLVVFFFLFFWQVVIQFSEELTNTARTTQKVELIEMPTFTICSGWKNTLFKEYNISPKIFNLPPGSDSNLPHNATMRTIFDEVVFKLNKDFVIGLTYFGAPEIILLKAGMNEINTGISIYKFEVKEIPTHITGMCYAIIPIGIYITVCL